MLTARQSRALRLRACVFIYSRGARFSRPAQRAAAQAAAASRCLAPRKGLRRRQRRQNRTSLAWPPANAYAVSRCKAVSVQRSLSAEIGTYRLYRSEKLYRHKGNLMITPVLMRGRGCWFITISRMEQTSAARPSIWRFSLRELLLVMLAAGAMLGWGVTLIPHLWFFKSSPFFAGNESWHAEVASIYEELGEPPFTGAAGTMMHCETSSSAQRTFIFQLPLSAGKQQAFLSALKNRVREKVRQAGCKWAGEAGGSGANAVDSVLGYTYGAVSGTFQICVLDAGNERAMVVVTMQEERGVSNGFGVEIRGD
jgi:hypothetical protein